MRKCNFGIAILLLIIFVSPILLSACKKDKENEQSVIKDQSLNSEDRENKAETDKSLADEPAVMPYTDLDQTAIVEAMRPGWNLGNQLEAVIDGLPKETNWGNPIITEELIIAVKEAGFKSIRIPVSYFSYIGEGPDYKIDEAWLDRIEEVVGYCVNNGLYTIINMHGDGYHTIDGAWLFVDEENQEPIRAKFQAVWRQVSERLAYFDEHLIFESMNEVFDGYYNDPRPEYYDNLNTYNQIFVDTVRQTGGNNAYRWLLVPGWNTDIEYTVGDYGFKIPEDNYLADELADEGETRIMISVHYYSPWDFCGGESGEITQWGESATDSSKVSTHSGQSYMAAKFKQLYERFTRRGYPVVVGEYGAIDKSDFDPQSEFYRAYFVRKVCENSVKYGCIPMYWDNGYNGRYGFGLFDREKVAVTQQGIIDAIMEVYYGRVEEGTGTGIVLDQTELTLVIGDEGVQLNAEITPPNSRDKIRWMSSDETIATVSDSGIVRPQTPGKAVISAVLPGGAKADCDITVAASMDVKVKLYAIETSTWSTISSEDEVVITSDGGTFTLEMTGSREVLKNIGSLFIKDVQVQSAVAKESVFKSAQILIDSFKFNGVECTPIAKGLEEAINQDSLAFDYCILNQWVEDSEKIKEVTKGDSGSYEFTTADYQDINKIELVFTVTDIVMP